MSSLPGSMISDAVVDAGIEEQTNFDIVVITLIVSVGAYLRVFMRDALAGLVK